MFEGFLLMVAIPSFFNMIYYAIGSPSGDNNTNGILFFYTRFLVKKRLNKLSIYNTFAQGNSLEEDVLLKKDCDTLDLQRALPLFTYENALGICPTCSYFWFSILFLFIPLLVLGYTFIVSFGLTMVSNIISKIFIKYI